MTRSSVGGWVEDWLSPPRFAVYLHAAGQDRNKALALYDWNSAVAAGFHHDLGHLEVGLRNAYDAVLRDGGQPDAPHWVFDPQRFFPPQIVKARNGRRYDSNEKPRRLIDEAVAKATPVGGLVERPSSGKVIAELGFGFWRYLSARKNVDRLWIPYLRSAFRPGIDRLDVDRRIEHLHLLRNRVAHHEPIFASNLQDRHRELIDLADMLSPELAAHIEVKSTCSRLLVERPEIRLCD